MTVRRFMANRLLRLAYRIAGQAYYFLPDGLYLRTKKTCGDPPRRWHKVL